MSDIKKILILALPRSGTTIIQTDLATLTKLSNLSEPLHDFDRNQLDRWYSWLGKLDLGFVAKFIAYQDLSENYSDVYNTIQGSLC